MDDLVIWDLVPMDPFNWAKILKMGKQLLSKKYTENY